MYHQELLEICREVWRSVAKMDLHVSPGSAEAFIAQKHLAGVIYITGGWNGMLIMRCPKALMELALVFIVGEVEGNNYDDLAIEDVLGELTNIVGGNFKAILPFSSKLSLPVVVDAHQQKLDLAQSECICSLMLQCEGHQLMVEAYENKGDNLA